LKRQRKRYTLEFKNRVLANLEGLKISKRQMAIRSGVDNRLIARWQNNKKEI